jgi:phage tail sheath protein FI
MPEYLSPGVYVQEVDSGTRPIEGVGTACAAFIGLAPDGPANKPELITNWTQYVETFGRIDEGGKRNPHMAGSYLSHSVYGYFLNGGGRCYVTRVVPSANGKHGKDNKAEVAQLQLPSRSSKGVPSLTIKTKSAPTQDIEVEVAAPSGDGLPEGTFTLRIRASGAEEELYENVGLGKKAARNVTETVNQASKLIIVVEEQGTGTLAERAPEIGTQVLRAAPQIALQPTLHTDDFAGSASDRSGMEGLQIAEDVTMVSCPDLMAAYEGGLLDRDAVKAVQLKMIAHCELMGDRIAILDPLPDMTPQEVGTWRKTETNYDSKYAVLYYPWIKVSGPDGRPMAVPPSGYMAGIWARNDTERGVHKAPANEVVRGVLSAAAPITKGEQDTLNPIGVNCIRSFTGRGVRVWGARTLSSDPAWRYINVRRLFNYVEKSIENGTQWVVFEPNDQDLWARVRRDVGAFLTGAWREGMLFGASSSEAFFVKCDAELNPPDVRDRGQLFIDVGLAPVKPAEFVVFRLSQYAGGGA